MRQILLWFLPFVLLSINGCAHEAAASNDDPQEVQADALSGYEGSRPNMTGIARPAEAPEGFYPEENVGNYYGPCGPLSATWLMTWYVGRGPGGTGSNQGAFDKVSSYAQGMRALPGSSPSGLAAAIDSVLDGSYFSDLARSKTGATIEEIRDLVARGRPVITLIQWWDQDARLPTMHYITVFGYHRVGEGNAYVVHDNGSFAEIDEASLETARDTSFYNRAIVWMDSPVSPTLRTQ